MKGRYCKIQGNDKIFLVEDCRGNIAFLNDGNIKVKTDISNISLLPKNFILPKRKEDVK